jgi:hypothetical protein
MFKIFRTFFYKEVLPEFEENNKPRDREREINKLLLQVVS